MKTRKIRGPEHDEQAALIKWTKLSFGKYPELKLLFAIPNGGKLPYTRGKNGKVFSLQRVKLVKEGLKSGVPDLFLPVARGKYHGLFIEMKAGKNKPSPEQLKWLDDLRKQNYAACVCYSFEKAKDILVDYLNGHGVPTL